MDKSRNGEEDIEYPPNDIDFDRLQVDIIVLNVIWANNQLF